MTCNWDDLEGKTGTIHIGRDIADGIQTKVVMFIAGDIHYVIAEYQTPAKRLSPEYLKELERIGIKP